jgi:hypothetical protein
MKKILLISLFASSALLASSYHCDAHQQDGECTTETVSLIGDQSTANEIIINPSRMSLANNDKKAAVSAQFIYSGDVTVINLPAGYNVTDNIGVELNVPVVSISDFNVWNPITFQNEKESNMGLGDISVGANYHFGNFSSDYGLNVSTFRYKTTSGDELKGLGLGKDAYTFSHNFAKDTDYLRVHALLSYTLNDEKVLGDALTAMVGISRPCLLNEKLKTNIKLTYFNLEETTRNNFTNSSGFKKIDLWIAFNSDKLFSGIPVGAGIKIPIIDEVSSRDFTGAKQTTDGSKTILFYLSAGSFFK